MSFLPIFIEWIINITFWIERREECSPIPFLIKLLAFNKSLSKIWIADVQTTKAYHICPIISNKLKTSLIGHCIISYHYSIKVRSQGFTNKLNLFGWRFLIISFSSRSFFAGSKLSWLSQLNKPIFLLLSSFNRWEKVSTGFRSYMSEYCDTGDNLIPTW